MSIHVTMLHHNVVFCLLVHVGVWITVQFPLKSLLGTLGFMTHETVPIFNDEWAFSTKCVECLLIGIFRFGSVFMVWTLVHGMFQTLVVFWTCVAYK